MTFHPKINDHEKEITCRAGKTSNDVIAGNGRLLFSTELTCCELNVNFFSFLFFEIVDSQFLKKILVG